MSEITGEPKPVPALVRFKLIMDALSEDTRPRGVSELARELGLPRSTVHGLCRTLAALGILSRVNSTEFAIGPHVLSWANAFERQNTVARAFATIADAMAEPEALNLSVLIGREVMYIGCREGGDPLAVRFREGLRFPAAYTATGKAILSTLPDDEVVELMGDDWPEPPAPNSVRNIDELRRDLEDTRRRGYSIDNGQLRPSLYSCGAPVFAAGAGSRAVAGVAIAMGLDRASGQNIERTGADVVEFAHEFSRRLGARV